MPGSTRMRFTPTRAGAGGVAEPLPGRVHLALRAVVGLDLVPVRDRPLPRSLSGPRIHLSLARSAAAPSRFWTMSYPSALSTTDSNSANLVAGDHDEAAWVGAHPLVVRNRDLEPIGAVAVRALAESRHRPPVFAVKSRLRLLDLLVHLAEDRLVAADPVRPLLAHRLLSRGSSARATSSPALVFRIMTYTIIFLHDGARARLPGAINKVARRCGYDRTPRV